MIKFHSSFFVEPKSLCLTNAGIASKLYHVFKGWVKRLTRQTQPQYQKYISLSVVIGQYVHIQQWRPGYQSTEHICSSEKERPIGVFCSLVWTVQRQLCFCQSNQDVMSHFLFFFWTFNHLQILLIGWVSLSYLCEYNCSTVGGQGAGVFRKACGMLIRQYCFPWNNQSKFMVALFS